MLRFRDILNFPSFYSKRQDSIRKVLMNITGINKDSESKQIDIDGSSGKYSQKIRFFGNDIISNSLVQITCDCESFKYEFSHAVFKNESLINPENFVENIRKKPLDKNKYQIPSGCKHIIALANLILKQKGRLL
jgi:hypothetical protein